MRKFFQSIVARVVGAPEERKRQDLQRLMVLAGLRADDPLWTTVLSYADEHVSNELEASLMPDLTDAQRQFRAGRAASALDFATALRDLRVKAQAEARKLKEE